MSSDEIRVHVATASATADSVRALRDYRSKWANLGVAGVHAVCALALALDKFADAITPKENNQ